MTFLPIAQRELRVSARSRVTRRWRILFALGADVGSNPVSLTVTVLAGDGSVLASNWFGPTVQFAYTTISSSFMATTTNIKIALTYSSAQTVGVDLILDDVTITAENPPTALAVSKNVAHTTSISELELRGVPGDVYQISSITNISDPTSWKKMMSVAITNVPQTVVLGARHQPLEFYRAIKQ